VGWTIGQLLDHLNQAADYVALTGLPGTGKTELAREVAERTSAWFVEDLAADLPTNGHRESAKPNALALEREILERRARSLRTEDESQQSRAAISDFWMGQSLAYGRLRLSHDDRAEVEDAWRVYEDQIGSPKLLVLLAAPIPWLAERAAATGASSSVDTVIRLERLHSELTDVALHARRGPVLQLDATQPAWALTELTAAIEAMR